MALHYTKKKDEATEKDVPATEFMKRVINLKIAPDERRKIDNIENPK